MVNKHKGIGGSVEDFVEQAHQIGMKEEKRTKGMRNMNQCINQ
jgi:hypothetical protein